MRRYETTINDGAFSIAISYVNGDEEAPRKWRRRKMRKSQQLGSRKTATRVNAVKRRVKRKVRRRKAV